MCVQHSIQADDRGHRPSVTSYFIFQVISFPNNLVLGLYAFFRPTQFLPPVSRFRFCLPAPVDLVVLQLVILALYQLQRIDGNPPSHLS
jgi:hypothetical protein